MLAIDTEPVVHGAPRSFDTNSHCARVDVGNHSQPILTAQTTHRLATRRWAEYDSDDEPLPNGDESAMSNLLRWTGRSAGIIGVLLCAVSVVARVAGVWAVGGFQVGTVLQAGMAAMILGCLAYLVVLVDGVRD